MTKGLPAAVVIALAVIGAATVHSGAIGDHDSAGPLPSPSPSYQLAKRMWHGSDVLLQVNTDAKIAIDVDFNQITYDEGQYAPSASVYIFSHNSLQNLASWVFYGHNRSAVAVWAGGKGVEAGPPLLTMYRELVGAQPEETDWWPEYELEPGHYHIVVTADHMEADLQLTIEGPAGAHLEVEEAVSPGDLAKVYHSTNPHDWDQKTEVWLTFAGVVDAHLDLTTASPLNWGFLYLAHFHKFEVRNDDGTMCSTDDVWWAVEGYLRPYVLLSGLEPGRYSVDVTRIGLPSDGPFTFLTFVEIPGHDEIPAVNGCWY